MLNLLRGYGMVEGFRDVGPGWLLRWRVVDVEGVLCRVEMVKLLRKVGRGERKHVLLKRQLVGNWWHGESAAVYGRHCVSCSIWREHGRSLGGRVLSRLGRL